MAEFPAVSEPESKQPDSGARDWGTEAAVGHGLAEVDRPASADERGQHGNGESGRPGGAGQHGKHETGRPHGLPVGQSGTQAIGQADIQAAGHSGTQDASQSGTQDASQSGTQDASQSATQDASHSGSRDAGYSGSQDADESGTQDAALSAGGPGPLALAASAAREAAEARIKAALHETRRSGLEPPYPLENPYPSETFDVTDLTPPQLTAAGPAAEADARSAAAIQGSFPRPEVASGAQHWPSPDQPEAANRHQQSDVASTWGGPDFGASDDEQPPVVPFRPRSDLAAYADEGAEPDPSYDERQDHSSAGVGRRNRIARGYSIPRLSRSKRPGAVPGA